MRMVQSQLINLPGEDLDTTELPEVASWITIYEELATVLRSVLARPGPQTDREDLRADLRRIEDRLSHWRSRHAELAGLAVDAGTRTVTYRGRAIALTRREADLLAFLLAHPDRPFSPRQLAIAAWNNEKLSDAQVRTYMMRLRRRLVELGVGNIIRVAKRRGYELNPQGAGAASLPELEDPV